MKRLKKHFHGIYWQQMLVTTGMVFLTLLMLGVSFFSLSYYYTRSQNAENIENKLYVNEIAEYLGLSVGHLSRIFKAATGYSVIEYINRQKIDKAKQLFESKTSSVRDAAAAVGIADEKYFSRLFKQYTGMTASEYKETLKIRAEMR